MVYLVCQWLITIFAVWLFDDFTNAGQIALAMSITNFFACIATYNIRTFQVSDIAGEYGDGIYITSRIVTCILAFITCAIFVFVFDFTALQRSVILFYMLFRVNEAFVDVFHGITQKHGRMDYIGISFALRGILMSGIFLLLGWLSDILPAVIGMFVITVGVVVFYDFSRTKSLVTLTLIWNRNILSLLKRCLPLMIVILIINLIPSYSRYAIERIHGTEALGLFSAAVAPAFVIQVASFFIFIPIITTFSDCLKNKDLKKFKNIFLACCIAIIIITLIALGGVYIFGEWVLTLLFGYTIRAYTYLLPGAVTAAALTAFIWFMNIIFSILRDIAGLLYGNAVGGLVCLAVTDVFLVNYGLAGANYVMIVAQGAAIAYLLSRLFWFIKRKERGHEYIKTK